MGGILINAGVINYGGLPSGGSGLLAARPAAGVVGRIYIASDSALLYRDTGSAWVTIGGSGPSGSGAIGQATFWTGVSTISGDNAFFWDNTNKRLGLGTTTPGVRLDVHGTGVLQQLNGTTTNNAYLDFQNAGSTQWRIGNFYNASANSFNIFNASAVSTILTILQTGNVGILTTNPLTRLHVTASTSLGQITCDGVGAIRSGINFANGGTNYGQIYFDNNPPYDLSLIQQFSTGSLFLGTNSTVKMAIANSGNVGIGYTAPASLLSVAGSALINTNTANALYELFVNGNTYTGGISPTIATQATSVAMTRTQTGYVCTATLTLTLPAVSGLNNFYIVVANTGATVTVQRAGADTILDKLGVSQTSVIVAAGTRSMFYVGGGSITYQIF
jgi:hypothetical protein